MEVQVKNLVSNPYRDIKNYPIDKDKIESLKNSIMQTEFWDNILARPKLNHSSFQYTGADLDEIDEDKTSKLVLVGLEISQEEFEKDEDNYIIISGHETRYFKQPILEIAYGHHRLQALKELKIDEVDIPIKELDDATMIQIMANENMEQWKMNPAVINETVKVARDFLNSELAKYESWEDMKDTKTYLINLLGTKDEANFQSLKTRGVGQTTILKFLGKGWKQTMIQTALNILDAKDIDREAVETLKNLSHVKEFTTAVRGINKERKVKKEEPITKEKQKEIVQKINKRIKSTGTGSNHTTIKTMVRQEVDQIDEFDATMKNLALDVDNITNKAKDLKNKVASFNGKLLEMGIEDLKGIQSLFIVNEFSLLLEAINTMGNYFGVQFNNLKKE